MKKNKVIIITSCKGGVGKSTIAANLSVILAGLNKKVLVIDCDFGMRCLDLIFGLDGRVIYDVSDVVMRNVSIDKALLVDERFSGLYFLAAPFNGMPLGFDNEKFSRIVLSYAAEKQIDYLIADTSTHTAESLMTASALTGTSQTMDTAVIIATHNPTSIRAASFTGDSVDKFGITHKRLIVNNFLPESVKHGEAPGIIEIIDKTFIQLIGIIPFDKKFADAQVRSELVNEKGCADYNTLMSFRNIASRLENSDCKSVPLLYGFKNVNRKVLLK